MDRKGKLNSDDYYIYYCGQESLRRNGVALIVNKSPKCRNAAPGCNLKIDRTISVHFQGKPFSITVIQLYAPTTDAEVDQFYEDLQHLPELTPRKMSFSSYAEKAMALHSSTLAWKIPWTEEPGRLESMGLLRVGQD